MYLLFKLIKSKSYPNLENPTLPCQKLVEKLVSFF